MMAMNASPYDSEVRMNRRILDLAVPIIYAVTVAATVVFGGTSAVVGVVLIGGLCVGFYFVATRQNMRDAPNDLPVRRDPPGHTHASPPIARERDGF